MTFLTYFTTIARKYDYFCSKCNRCWSLPSYCSV